MDAEDPHGGAGAPSAKLRSVLLFDVAADTPHRALTRATDAGVAAAREALGAPPLVTGALASAREGKKRVRLELAMRAPPATMMQAERAFADAFVSALEKKGHAVERS